jgi:hypothetical protein
MDSKAYCACMDYCRFVFVNGTSSALVGCDVAGVLANVAFHAVFALLCAFFYVVSVQKSEEIAARKYNILYYLQVSVVSAAMSAKL